jgi:hypothetical protein
MLSVTLMKETIKAREGAYRAKADSLKQSKSIKPQVKNSRWHSNQKIKDPNTG